MGFFKDIHQVTKQAKEIDKNWDPGAQARDANARMAAMNQSFAQVTAALTAPPGDGVDATAQVVSVAMTNGMVNMEAMVPVELLVMAPGEPPRPASVTILVPMNQMHRVQAGASLPVKVSKSDPSAIAVNWGAAG